MLETELAYTAGIIDGEGTIVIERSRDNKPQQSTQRHRNRTRNHSGIKYRMHVSVLIREKSLCEWLRLNYGGSVYMAGKPTNPNHSQCWVWRVGSGVASGFLKQIIPYLHLKKLQAENAIRFQLLVESKRRSPLSVGELAIRETLRDIQSSLNAKGVNRS